MEAKNPVEVRSSWFYRDRSHSSLRLSYLFPIFNGRSEYQLLSCLLLWTLALPPSLPPSSSSPLHLLLLCQFFLSLSRSLDSVVLSSLSLSLERALTMLEAKSWKLRRRKTRCFWRHRGRFSPQIKQSQKDMLLNICVLVQSASAFVTLGVLT